MEFNEGDSVIYTFPTPVDGAKKQFEGEIYMITDGWIFIKSTEGMILKVSHYNAELIEQTGEKRQAI